MDIWVLHKEKKKRKSKRIKSIGRGADGQNVVGELERRFVLLLFSSLCFFFLDSQKFDRRNSSG